ncbi:MAG: DUF1552 domain-containing protein [Myxococcaceae bacterium]|nr:DUF1552 domain-containing protein [Myxococcaceae bacterium]
MFTRRAFLQSVAATGLFAALYREAFAQSVTPRRLVLVLECNGIYPEAFLSAGTRAALGAEKIGGRHHNFGDSYPDSPLVREGDDLSTALCLQPLAGSGAEISLVNRSAVVLGLSSLITGGGHSTGTGALSCAVDGAAATFDAVIAPRLKGTAPFDAIRLGTSSSLTPIAYQTCAYGPRRPAGILVNPALAWNTIFGSIAAGTSAGLERSMLFDFARDDVVTALKTFSGNSRERAKLERYLESLEKLRAREAQLKSMAAKVQPLLPPAPADNPLLQGGGSPPDSLKWLEAQFEIATSALLGGLTNLVVLASGTSGFDVHYDSIIPDIGRHDLQHGIDNPGNYTAIAAVTRKHVELVAKLARALEATPEVGADGTMLDHTIIVYMSDNGEQHHSEAREWPKLIVGGNALGMKTDGRTVIYPRDGAARNRQVSNLFNTLGHAFGDSDFNTFGAEGTTRIAAGPLSEIWA